MKQKFDCCTDYISNKLNKIGQIPDLNYKISSNITLEAKKNTYIKEKLFNNNYVEREVIIFKDSSCVLLIYSEEKIKFLRSSSGLQIIYNSEKNPISHINYLDDCVLCSKHINFIFYNLLKGLSNEQRF